MDPRNDLAELIQNQVPGNWISATRIVVAFIDQNSAGFVVQRDAIQIVEDVVHDATTESPRDHRQRRERLGGLVVPAGDAGTTRQNDRAFGRRIHAILLLELKNRLFEPSRIGQLLRAEGQSR